MVFFLEVPSLADSQHMSEQDEYEFRLSWDHPILHLHLPPQQTHIFLFVNSFLENILRRILITISPTLSILLGKPCLLLP